MSKSISKTDMPKKQNIIGDFVANTFFDVGFLFALGNAILIPGPLTFWAAVGIYGMKVTGHVGTHLLPTLSSEEKQTSSRFAKMVRNGIQVLKDPDTSLIVAGIALAPVAVLAFQTVPTGLGMGALLSNSAFLGGMTASLFSVFDISKALQNKGKLPRMTHKGIGRVINTAADPENIATVGLMFTAAMAGPVGWLLAPVIGMGGVVATINAQKTDYSNKGRPKLWFAAACALSATASLATGQVQAMGAVIANYVFAASYVRLETYESDDFLGSMKRSLKKIISSPLQQRKASNAKTTKKDISQGVTPAIHIDNAEKGGGISKQVSARPNPKKRIGLLPIFARFGRPQQKKKTPKKNRTTNPKNL